MNTEVLSYCIDIAKSKNFTRTAEKYHISQQAMSQQIKNLEWELGIQLFERNNRTVRVTSAGEVFLREVAIALQQLETAILSAKAFARGQRGSIILGYNGPSSQRYLAEVLEQFYSAYPGIEVNLATGTNLEILEQFYSRTLDLIAVGDFVVFDPDVYNVVQCKSGVVCAVVGKGHPFANRECVSTVELLEDTYISLDFREQPNMLERSMERCERLLGEVPHNVIYVDNTETIDIVVASGTGFTLLNSDLKGYYKSTSLSFVRIAGATVSHSSRFVWRKDNSNPAITFFLKTADSIGLTQDSE